MASGISQLFDTTTKRWMAVLIAAVLASGAAMVHSLLTVMGPSEEPVVAVELPPRVLAPPVVTRAEPAWNGSSAESSDGQTAAPVHASPFETERLAKQEAKEAVHHQAEYLRKIMVNGRLPESLGGLTKQQVDEMEAKGVMIE